VVAGALVAFEGLDQSGKQTQAERLAAACRAAGRTVRLVSFPDYATSIGVEIGQALHGQRGYGPYVLQLLYIANRYEYRPRLEAWLAAGDVVIADRYLASSAAYGEAQGLAVDWLLDVQRHLPAPAVTLLLDIAPETSLARKRAARDHFERDLPLLGRVRTSYHGLAARLGWVQLDGEGESDVVHAQVLNAVRAPLALP
jgi:dTMP kinase